MQKYPAGFFQTGLFFVNQTAVVALPSAIIGNIPIIAVDVLNGRVPLFEKHEIILSKG